MMTRSIILAAAAVVLGTGVASAEIVVVTEPVPTERVSFADLNLASAAGQGTLQSRIRGAAKRVCMSSGDRSLETYIADHSCFRTALGDGLKQMTDVIAGRASGSTVATATLIIRSK
jgi:UrcA family protein